jgi:cytochrome b6-f complex iron-sulfur subunit
MTLSRRRFISRTVATGVALGSAGRLVTGCGNNVLAAPIVDAVVIDDPQSPRYGWIPVEVTRYPDLMPVGGAVTLRLAPMPPGTRPFRVPEGGILLVHRGAPGDAYEYVAVDSQCTHAGCPLGYSNQDRLIECPCHGSRFLAAPDSSQPDAAPGEVVRRPALASLQSWQVHVDALDQVVAVDLTLPLSQPALPSPSGGKITFAIADFPALAGGGGFVVGQPQGFADTLLIVRVSDTSIVTLSAICTHLACTVSYSPSNQQVVCPCHGSTFDLMGNVTHSPATLPLKAYATSFDGQTVIINVS